jgi:hypothetical protein
MSIEYYVIKSQVFINNIQPTDSQTWVACSILAPLADIVGSAENEGDSPKTTAKASSKLRLLTILKAWNRNFPVEKQRH